jgi:hypothetical protein
MSKTEFVDMSFPNGETWRVTAYPIAEERAQFFVEHESINYEDVVRDEIEYALSPEGFDDLLYYIENYMEWKCLDKRLLRKKEITPSYEDWLLTGAFVSEAIYK